MQSVSEYFLYLLKLFCKLFKNLLLLILWGDYNPFDAFDFVDGAQPNTGDFIDFAINKNDCILPDAFESNKCVEANHIFR